MKLIISNPVPAFLYYTANLSEPLNYLL